MGCQTLPGACGPPTLKQKEWTGLLKKYFLQWSGFIYLNPYITTQESDQFTIKIDLSLKYSTALCTIHFDSDVPKTLEK